jgi:hypothetical protein
MWALLNDIQSKSWMEDFSEVWIDCVKCLIHWAPKPTCLFVLGKNKHNIIYIPTSTRLLRSVTVETPPECSTWWQSLFHVTWDARGRGYIVRLFFHVIRRFAFKHRLDKGHLAPLFRTFFTSIIPNFQSYACFLFNRRY